MEGDIALGLKYVGAGLATLGMIGAALGVGNIFASFLDAAMRNPSAAPQQTGNLFIGMALAEALGILAFLVSVLILFVVQRRLFWTIDLDWPVAVNARGPVSTIQTDKVAP